MSGVFSLQYNIGSRVWFPNTSLWFKEMVDIFMPPAWRVRRGHLVIRSSVCLSVRNSVPLTKQSAIFKVWVMIKLPNLDCRFIYGFLTLHWYHVPLRVGRGQNVGLGDFCHIMTMLSPGGSVFHKHMSSYSWKPCVLGLTLIFNVFGYISYLYKVLS